MKPLRLVPALLLPLASSDALAQRRSGELFERVVGVLAESYYDEGFRERELPDLARRYAEAARAADSLDEERYVVHELLSRIPVSHLGLLSSQGRDRMWAELGGKAVLTFGFQLVEVDGGWFADWVYEGGPADRAGVVRGDEVLSIDGVHPSRSERLDWRTDDCALPDPAIHALLGEEGDEIELVIRRGEGRRGRLRLAIERYSAWEAARQSVAEYDVGPFRVGFVHYWYIQMSGPSRFLRELCTERFADCDALVFDLRGRGGAAHEAFRIARDLDAREGVWRKPLVLLVDDGTRSAKEVITHELRTSHSAIVVGEKTPGAVIPATFRDVGSDTVLMFPSFTLGTHTSEIEGVGIVPDVEVAYPLSWTAGADPVLEAGLLAARAWCEEIACTPTVGR